MRTKMVLKAGIKQKVLYRNEASYKLDLDLFIKREGLKVLEETINDDGTVVAVWIRPYKGMPLIES